MMLKKIALTTAISIMLASGTSWGFGLPKIPGVPAAGGGGVSADAVEQFIATGKESNDRINKSRIGLAMALSTKEERAQLMELNKQLSASLSTNDKKAQEEVQKKLSSMDAETKAKMADQERLDKLKGLSVEQIALVGKSAKNLVKGILAQKEQVTAGQNMVTQISANPMLAIKLPAIKDTISTMTSNISGTAGYIANFPKLFKSMGVDVVLPTTKDDKVAEISEEDMQAFTSTEGKP